MGLLSTVERSANFSRDRRFRWLLTILWDKSKPMLNVCMLNPSTADEHQDDPTVERACGHARRLGMGGLLVTNAYAFKATNPKDLLARLRSGEEVVGKENDRYIVRAAQAASLVVCGWGSHIEVLRAEHVLRLIRTNAKRTPHALIFTKGGQPGHPLYLPYEGCPPMEITHPNFCMECGYEIAPEMGTGLCGECSCEEDGI